MIWRKVFRPFGSELDDGGAIARDNTIGYTGHRFDNDLDLVYAGARYYDPMIGRFLSMDPVGFQEGNVHSFNKYAYANNNPYKYFDPDGRDAALFTAVTPIIPPSDATPEQLEQAAIANEAQRKGVIWGGAAAGVIMTTGTRELGAEIITSVTGIEIPSIRTLGKKFAAKGARNLIKFQLKSIKSLEKQIQKHQQKPDDFKTNPTVKPGMENLPKDVIKKQQQARIKHLEMEINTFKKNIEKIKNGEL